MPSTPARICPLCEKETDELRCPSDGVPTLEPAVYSPAEDHIAPGTIVAERYKVERVLGKGGMGAVFVATQLSMNRTVALKVLRRDVTQTARHVKRFYQEAQAASQLNHPNIVRVFDFGIDAATREPFIAMELIAGRTLHKLLESGPLQVKRAALILAQVAKALVDAHEKSIIHRDLKPDNIMVAELPDGDEHVSVLDFGVAKMIRPEDSGGEHESLTATGSTVGTPLYMSPEQVSGERIDFRSDLYALGCILHETLTGAPPFTGPEAITVLLKHVNDPVPELPDLSTSGEPIPAALKVLHTSLLAKQRLLRPGSTTVVARVLSAIARGEEPDVGAILEAEAKRDSDAGLTPRTPMRAVDIKAPTLPIEVPPAVSSHFDIVPPPVAQRRTMWIAAAVVVLALISIAAVFALRERPAEPIHEQVIVETPPVIAPAPIADEQKTPSHPVEQTAEEPQQPREQPIKQSKKRPALKTQR